MTVEPSKRCGCVTLRTLCIIITFASFITPSYFMGVHIHRIILMHAPKESKLHDPDAEDVWAEALKYHEDDFFFDMHVASSCAATCAGVGIFVNLLNVCAVFSDLKYFLLPYLIYQPVYLLMQIAASISISTLYDKATDIGYNVALGFTVLLHTAFEVFMILRYRELKGIKQKRKERELARIEAQKDELGENRSLPPMSLTPGEDVESAFA